MRSNNFRACNLDEVGDKDAPVGSRPWAVYFLRLAKAARKDLDADAERLRRLLSELEAGKAWGALELMSFEQLLAVELQLSADQARAITSAPDGTTLRAVLVMRDARPALTAKEAGAKGGRGNKGSDNVTPFKRGNSAEYLSGLLLRDHPDIAAAVERGEYRSIRAAAIAAGIVKVKSPLDHLLHWWARCGEQERAVFLSRVAL